MKQHVRLLCDNLLRKFCSAWFSAALFLLAGCGDSCQLLVLRPDVIPAITVEVRDSITGLAVATSAIGSAKDGAFVSALDVVDSLRLSGLINRPGTYDLTVHKSGYRDWSVKGIKAPSTPCGLYTVTVSARLVATSVALTLFTAHDGSPAEF